MNQIKAVIEMGNPRFRSGVAYQVGTCKTQGFSPRPQGYSCSVRIRCQNVLKRNPKLIRINSPQARSKATATARTPTAAPATTQTCTRATAKSTARLHSLSSRVSSATAPEAAAEAVAAPLRLRLPPARAARLRLLRLRGAAVLPSGGSVAGKGESLYHFSSCRRECFLGVLLKNQL
jgi:hypothetical protein